MLPVNLFVKRPTGPHSERTFSMEERALRLGSVIEDYCSKCRLLLDHAVQAIYEGTIQSVMCNTCMSAHAYKNGKIPKKRGGKQSLFDQILSKRMPSQSTGTGDGEGEEER
jgi:hypothetical protein